MTALFISDLHLSEARPRITEAFFSFLQQEAKSCQQLYILGDLFDAWVGDDDDSALALSVARQLKQLAESSSQIYFQHGNRDFLLGEQYAESCHMQLLPELHTIQCGLQRCLLAHGDQFCTEDTEYQKFRQLVRNGDWQRDLLKKSLSERRQIAQQLRDKSREANSLKSEYIMDVTERVCVHTMRMHNCSLLIHGHTHRPARHQLTLEGNQHVERLVLGDWEDCFYYAKVIDGNIELIKKAIKS